jgi:uncharacterized membrane protein (TIGR02234 family)
MADPGRQGRLGVRIAQLLLVIAAAGLWAAARLPWVAVVSFDGLGPPTTVTLSGGSWSTALLPLALLLLVTAVAAVAVGGWPLRVLAVLVAAVSLAIGYLAISQWVVRDVAVRAADLAHVSLLTLVGSQRYYTGAAIAVAAAVCTLAGAVLLMRSARPGGAAKYITPAALRSQARREEGTMSEQMIWDALDEGRDPTREPRHESDTEGR